MMSLLYKIMPILPILLLIFSIIVMFYISIYNKKVHIGFLVITFSIFLSILAVIFSKYLFLSYFSELICIDQNAYFYIFLLLLSSLYTCLFAYPWLLSVDIGSIEFYFFILLATIGSILVAISIHFFTLFLGLELLFLPVLGILFFFSKSTKNLFLIMIYMILSIFSSILLLLGFSLVYFVSGRLSFSFFSYLFVYYPSLMVGSIMLFGICMIFLSLFFKLSLFPLHTWSLGIYQNFNSCSLIFFSTITKISIFSFFIHFFHYFSFINKISSIYLILEFFSIFSIFFGNIAAVLQNNIQRLIGYASISNLGFLLAVLVNSSFNEYVFINQYLYIYLMGYILGLIGFFSIKSIIDFNFFFDEKDTMAIDNSLVGLFRRDYILGIIMTIILLSLSGFPITLGFWGKFFIFKFLIQKNYLLLTVIMILSSIVGMHGYLRIIASLYQYPVNCKKKCSSNNNFFIFKIQKLFIICIALVLVILGIFPQFIFHIIKI